jgi:very-short-patch-repair endonuclease
MSYCFNPKLSEDYRKNLRNESTEPERRLWSKLRNKQIEGCKFRRQFGIGIFIVDFYCPDLKLAIEIDGDSHAGEKAGEYDKYREKSLAEFGIRCLRFTNYEVMRNLDGVVVTIRNHIADGDNPS